MREIAGHKRTRYLVAKEFQLKYVGMIFLLVFLTGALCSYVVYYTSMLLMGDRLANVYPQGQLVSIVNTVNIRILLSLILVSPLVAVIGISVSHRIAGPLFRMERFLNEMASGDFSSRLTLRKNDELIVLANCINRVIDSVRGTVDRERAHMARISALLSTIKHDAESKHMSKTAVEKELDTLISELDGLQKEVNSYKM